MKAKLTFFFSIFLVCKILASPSVSNDLTRGPPFRSNGEGPLFFIDYTNFRGVDDLTFVEFYIQVGYHRLQFFKNDNRFRAGYDLEFYVLDDEENVVEHYTYNDVFEVDTYAETQDTKKAQVALLGFSFDPGKYKIRSILTDIETLKSSRIEQNFYALNFRSDSLLVSEIQLSQKIEPAEEGEPFVKNQRYIEPNAVRTFARTNANIFIYFEIYNLAIPQQQESSQYTTYLIIHDDQDKKIANVIRRQTKPGMTSAHSIKIPIENFLNGTYFLTVKVRDNETDETVETSKSFTFLDWPISLGSHEFLD